MNVLSLLVANENVVYSTHGELEAQHKKYAPAVIGRKLFRLHVQCISRHRNSLEEVVLRAALEELARIHPDAPAPALFEVGKLFTSAKRLLEDLGEDKFFAAFPSNQIEDPQWGSLAGWDRERFEEAIQKPGSEEARGLAGELAKTPWLEGMAATSDLVSLGPGLQILADHLKRLGYEGIVLFLDELVLWLATIQDPNVLAGETRKVSTLVEHGDYPPSLPYLTFAARQRDLSEMVGKSAIGEDEKVFRAQLSYWKDRFETISLEDKDLPRIIEKRVLRPVSKEASGEIDRAFESYKRAYASDFRQLNGNQGEADDFRRVYPFSPALVEVMVALSATLQRERTALRELTNLLVRYLPDFELGKVVPVGDLFDVVAHGQTSDLPAIQKLYEQARRIYEYDLLPHIQKKYGTTTGEKCQLHRENFDKRLGCSGCPMAACRTHTRIAKTVLLQGIVPNTPVLRNLNAQGLVYLNSGVLKSKVPNQEPSQAAQLVNDLKDASPAIHVEGVANPIVRCILDVIDVRRILDYCRDLDNEQRRRIRVRQILFEKMLVKMDEQTGTRTVDWRGRRWYVGFVYDNVRTTTPQSFRASNDEDLRVVLDYPFDEMGHGPRDDEERLHKILAELGEKEAERGLPTIVWLPAFIDEDMRRVLGDLCVLDALVGLQDKDLAARVPWVSMDELARVRGTLEQQQGHKRQQLENALGRAYGVLPGAMSLAAGLAPEQRAHLLRHDTRLNVPADGLWDQALEALVKQALEIRAPRHPALAKIPTKQRLETVLDLLGKLFDTPERRLRFSKGEIDELRAIAAAENLGIVRVIEDDATYAGGIFDSMARNLANQKGTLSVGMAKQAIDPEGWMQLSTEIEDFLVLGYARGAVKPFRLTSDEQVVQGQIGKLSDHMMLWPVELPGQELWQAALYASKLLGLSIGPALTSQRVEELATKTREAAGKIDTKQIGRALDALRQWHTLVDLAESVESTPRGMTLNMLRDLVQSIRDARGESIVVVKALGQWRPDEARATATAMTKMANSGALEALCRTLESDNTKTQFAAWRTVAANPAFRPQVEAIMKTVREALTQNENIVALELVLQKQGTEINKLLNEMMHRPAQPPPTQTPLPQATINLAMPETTAPVPRVEHLVPPTQGALTFVNPVQQAPKSVNSILIRTAEDLEKFSREMHEHLDDGKQLRITLEVLDAKKS